MEQFIKPPVEVRYKEELDMLRFADNGRKPENWVLSPRAVRTFILGGEVMTKDGEETISRKFYGNDALVERAVITLAGSRGLMLVGEPGTAKTMLSELLCAAISGVSTNTVQGTAGTTEDMIKYSWNYALLLSKGPCREALVPAPLLIGMEKGIITRFEEITRTPAEIQDSLISVMSDQILNIPELGDDGLVLSRPGFNIIKRRFNFETVEPVKDVRLEKEIIVREAEDLAKAGHIDAPIDTDVAELLAVTYHELREGRTENGTVVQKPNAVMSTAEAVSVYYQTISHAWYLGSDRVSLDVLADNLLGAVCKENKDDLNTLRGYFRTALKEKGSSKGGDIWTQYLNKALLLR